MPPSIMTFLKTWLGKYKNTRALARHWSRTCLRLPANQFYWRKKTLYSGSKSISSIFRPISQQKQSNPESIFALVSTWKVHIQDQHVAFFVNTLRCTLANRRGNIAPFFQGWRMEIMLKRIFHEKHLLLLQALVTAEADWGGGVWAGRPKR